MRGESGTRWGEPDGHEEPGPDAGPLADMLGAHAGHVLDYCRALLGREDEASGAAQAALVSAHALLADPGRLRAWLFALARQQILATNPGGVGLDYTPQPPPLPVDDPAATDPVPRAAAATPDAVQAALRALPSRDRELLDLVYRHGIRPDDLPAVLWMTAEEAHEQLAAAEAELARLAALQDAGSPPVATLPGSGESPISQARRRVRLTAVATVPAAVIAAAVTYLAGPTQTVGSHHLARPPASTVSPGVDAQTGTPVSAASGRPHHGGGAAHVSSRLADPGALPPASPPATRTRSKKPSPRASSPSPSTSSPSPSPTTSGPSPSPTTLSPSPSPSPTTSGPSPSPTTLSPSPSASTLSVSPTSPASTSPAA